MKEAAAPVLDCLTKEQAEVQSNGSVETYWRLRDPCASSYYPNKRQAGRSQAGPSRSLGQRQLKIVFRMIHDNRPYDPVLHARNQQKNGSGVLTLDHKTPGPATGDSQSRQLAQDLLFSRA